MRGLGEAAEEAEARSGHGLGTVYMEKGKGRESAHGDKFVVLVWQWKWNWFRS